MTENKRKLSVEIRGGDKVHLKESIADGLSGKIVKIEKTTINFQPGKPWQFLITVRNRDLPLDVIHRGHPLIRDGHKIPLINKKLIIRP